MTEQHECDWRIFLAIPNSATARIRIRCRICHESLSRQNAEDMLNEHASQKTEIETYKHEVSVLRQLLDDDGTLALETIEQQEGEIQALREYATHKPGCHENGEKCICELDALLTSQEEPTKR